MGLHDYDPNTRHIITRGQIEHVLKCLRFIDGAREELAKKGPGNESIINELRNCAQGIYETMNQTPRADA
ncbi:MAG: hypothetical protein IT179_07920 [Acidobacteria bacterium]|nr:hypothetical protein [Acidobacteriota bacterium]